MSIFEIDDWHFKRGFRRKDRWRLVQQMQLRAVGYHFFISLDGVVTYGRHIDEIGAHVQGNNAHSIGICMAGTDKFTARQWAALRQHVQLLQHGYPDAKICGHRDYSPDLDGDGIVEPWEWMKTCPGFDVATWLEQGMNPADAWRLS